MIQKIEASFEIKELSTEGTFAGYASVFDIEDYYGDIVAKGAFKRTLNGKRKRQPALLWQHRAAEPIGVWDHMEEDDKGLFAEGRLALATQRGREAYELLKIKAISGLSIGFTPVKYQIDEDTGKRTLLDIDLWETSLVTFPANDAARIGQVRAVLNSGELPQPKLVEDVLRDAGFSIKQAKAIVARGLSSLRLRDVVDDGDHEDLEIAAAMQLLERIRSATEAIRNGSPGNNSGDRPDLRGIQEG